MNRSEKFMISLLFRSAISFLLKKSKRLAYHNNEDTIDNLSPQVPKFGWNFVDILCLNIIHFTSFQGQGDV